MFDLGTWAPFIDEPSLLQWYDLPADLRRELQSYVADGTELTDMSGPQWRTFNRAVVRYADGSVAQYKNAYHNCDHFRITEENGMLALATYERLTGKKVPGLVRKLFAAALRLHDCHHCGATFRADSVKPLYNPGLGTRISQEWVSGQAANELGKKHGLNAPSRLFMLMVIWASTFGGATPKGKALGIPNVKPVGLWGCIMRASDVRPPRSPVESIKRSIAVHFGEIGATPRPVTWEAMIDDQLGFFGYVEHCYNELDKAAGRGLTAQLGWRSELATLRRVTESWRSRPNSREVREIEAELLKYGFTLS